MEAERRRQILLGVLVVVLGIAGYWYFLGTSSSPAPASNGGTSRTAPAGRSAAKPDEAPDVHLNALEAERPKPTEAVRNLFRFKPKAPPPPPPAPPRAERPVAPPVVMQPPVPVAPPPVPPITLKFIGIVEVPGKSVRFAVLTDGRGLPIQGKEGDIIEGRYRILKIGAESIEMAYLDGRGRQTIRLSGG